MPVGHHLPLHRPSDGWQYLQEFRPRRVRDLKDKGEARPDTLDEEHLATVDCAELHIPHVNAG